MRLSFQVEGTPAPQGSKTGRSYCGQTAKVCPHCRKPHLVNVNMVESSAKVKPWREAVAAKAQFVLRTGFTSWQPFDGPVTVAVTFILKRPKAHYRTGKFADLLRDDAPEFPHNTPGMDTDKLARAVLDALTAASVYGDDSQVIELRARKIYAGPRHPGAFITVAPYCREEQS